MPKVLNAQKQKDTRTLKYDPEGDSLTRTIEQFQKYRKNAKFYKEYSEMEIFSFFNAINFMKIVDEKNKEEVQETTKRQNKIKLKYNKFIEYDKWSDSPLADKTKPLSLTKRIIIISAFVLIIIVMLLIIIGLNKWW
ncbi:Hypothetical protein, predicted transmembrane protein [Metamycoplasma auris 15026]|uniref:Uncharacterized protein n=1 Tax=Metamycoplasma auris 15026 TaxID=1188233 RepID=N9VB92_9BACT|nr:hypothetical protein [Metamycoplasma auris]ENY68656.1 Hypothetical protein, predicted transmembrane protein [Metamycoplasma auris 15026]